MKLKIFDGYPRLCLFATKTIAKGDEIRYDYGEDGCKLAWRREKERPKKECYADSDSDENPFGLPDSTEEQSSELDTNTEESEEYEYMDTDMSDAKDPSYKLPETYSETSCSTYSDIIPNIQSSFKSGCTFGVLGKRAQDQDALTNTEPSAEDNTSQKYSDGQETAENTEPPVEYNESQTYSDVQEIAVKPELPVENDKSKTISDIQEPAENSEPSVENNKSQTVSDVPETAENTESTVQSNRSQTYSDVQEISVNTELPEENNTSQTYSDVPETAENTESTVQSNRSQTYSDVQEISVNTELPEENNTSQTYSDFQEISVNTKPPVENNMSQPYSGAYTSRQSDVQETAENTESAAENNESQTNSESQETARNTVPEKENFESQTYPDDQEVAEYNEQPVKNNGRQTNSGQVCPTCEKCFKTRGALTTHMKKHTKTTDEEYERPSRVCPFCNDIQQHTQLPRHIELKHKAIPAVAEALKLPKYSKERNNALAVFRKEGILRYNKFQAQLQNPKYMSERKNQDDLVCCSKCKGFYGRKLFHRHKSACTGDSALLPVSVHMDAFRTCQNDEDEQFSKVILSRFQRDDIGNFCRSDPTMIIIGRRLFQKIKKKPDNMTDTKKGVMSDMRLIARLFGKVKEHGQCEAVEDMFLRKNFKALETAIDIVTRDDTDKLRYGVKHHVQYLLLTVHDILVGHLYGLSKDEKAAEMEKWKKLFDLNKNLIFGDSTYAITISRQEKLRMPEQMAEEEEVTKLRQHITGEIQKCISEFTFIGPHEFVLLRDSLCSRLTLFNARRGGEPARMTLQHYNNAKSGRWVKNKDLNDIDSVERQLFKMMDITYQPGKGQHFVSNFIPDDCMKGLDLLTDPEVRRSAGVAPDNNFIFANTQGSDSHVQGWDAINKMCEGAKSKSPELLTATKQRHRISTIYSAMDVPESERDFFYKHMGHSKAVNIGTYQYPLPIMAVTKVGKHLLAIDKASASATATCTATSAEYEEEATQSDHDVTLNAESQNIDTMSAADIYTTDGREPQATSGLSFGQMPTQQLLAANEVAVPVDDSRFISVQKSSQPGLECTSVRRDYFKWSEEETQSINNDFHEWIMASDGNSLPSKSILKEYMENKNCRYNYKQLRTKIMNEQNKQQSRTKKRLKQMIL